MKMPKYKPTKWKLDYCLDCKEIVERYSYLCKRSHTVVQRDNAPFFIPEMKIDKFGTWTYLISDKPKKTHLMSISNIGKMILGCGIDPGGIIRNQWWMQCKVGGSISLKWLPSDK